MLGSLVLYLKGTRIVMFQLSGFYNICNTPPHLAIPVHHIFSARPLIWPFALSFGDSGSSYIFSMSPHLALRPLMAWLWFRSDSGSSYSLSANLF